MKFFLSGQPIIGTQIVNASSAREAFDLAQRHKHLVDIHKWLAVRDNVMKEALIAKFSQDSGLKALLLSTRGKTLVEHTTNDNYWGDNGDGTGVNRLGQLLMEVRDYYL